MAAGSEGRLQGGLAGCQVGGGAVPGIVHTFLTTCPVQSQQPAQADPWIRQWTGIVWAFLHSVGATYLCDRRCGHGRLKMARGAEKEISWKIGGKFSGKIDCKVHLSQDWFLIIFAAPAIGEKLVFSAPGSSF